MMNQEGILNDGGGGEVRWELYKANQGISPSCRTEDGQVDLAEMDENGNKNECGMRAKTKTEVVKTVHFVV